MARLIFQNIAKSAINAPENDAKSAIIALECVGMRWNALVSKHRMKVFQNTDLRQIYDNLYFMQQNSRKNV